MRVRVAIAAFTLLALAGFHLQPSLAGGTQSAPVAAPVAPVASPGPTVDTRWSALATAIQRAQEARNVDVWTWAAAVNAARTTKSMKNRNLPTPVTYEPGSIEALICSVFGPSCAKAVAIARCESGLNPAARNRSGAEGLFQLLGHGDMFVAHGWSATDWADPYKNAVVAFDLSRGGTSWGAWVCA